MALRFLREARMTATPYRERFRCEFRIVGDGLVKARGNLERISPITLNLVIRVIPLILGRTRPMRAGMPALQHIQSYPASQPYSFVNI